MTENEQKLEVTTNEEAGSFIGEYNYELAEPVNKLQYIYTEIIPVHDINTVICRHEIYELLETLYNMGVIISHKSPNATWLTIPGKGRTIQILSVELAKNANGEWLIQCIRTLFDNDSSSDQNKFCSFIIGTEVINCAKIFYSFLNDGTMPSNDPGYLTSTQ